MATTLTGNGTIQYGNFEFGGPRVSTTLEIEPHYDDAGRAVEYLVYHINVTAYLTDDFEGLGGIGADGDAEGESAAAVLASAEANLTKPGLALTITGLGYADLVVDGGSRDVRWGPKPKLLSFRPVGGVGVFECIWQCEVAVNRCAASQSISGVLGGLISANYAVDYSIDYYGLMTRTVTGHIAIAANRSSAGGNAIAQTADDFRERIVVVMPLADFRRERQEFRLSADKSRLDFMIVDRQLPGDNAFPQGVVDMDLTHVVGASRGLGGFSIVTHEFSGHVETAKNVARSVGLTLALLILRDRATFIRQRLAGIGKNLVLIDAVSFTEHVFTRRIDFNVRLRAFPHGEKKAGNRSPLNTLLVDAGFLNKVSSTDFVAWNRSLANDAWNPRGAARLKHVASSDRIISPCEGGTGLVISDAAVRPSSAGPLGSLADPCPPPNASYVFQKYATSIDFGAAEVDLPAMPIQPQPASGGAGAIRGGMTGVDGPSNLAPTGGSTTTVTHKVAPDKKAFRLCLSAARVCYKVDPPPELKLHLGRVWKILKPKSVNVEEAELGSLGNHTLYGAKWCALYEVDEATAQYIKDRVQAEGTEWITSEGT